MSIRLTLIFTLLLFLTPVYSVSDGPQPIRVSIPTVKYNDGPYSKLLSAGKHSVFDEKLAELFVLSKATGLNACIYLPDEGLWKGALGVGDSISKIPVTPSSKFHAGSIGKMITATLILRLIEQKRFTLKTKISHWFKGTKQAGFISIDDLLNHKAGLPGHFVSQLSNQTLLEKANSTLNNELFFAPVTGFSYSNPGYIILSLILEQEHKRSLAQLIETDFIQYLSLRESVAITVNNKDTVLVNSTLDSSLRDDEIDYSTIGGAGILATTPCDLVRSLNALLARKIVNAKTVKKMTKTAYPMNLEATMHWTRGLMLLDTPLGRVHFLSGQIGGFGASVIYHPELNAFVSIMVNDGNQVGPVLFHLLKAIDNLKKVDL